MPIFFALGPIFWILQGFKILAFCGYLGTLNSYISATKRAMSKKFVVL